MIPKEELILGEVYVGGFGGNKEDYITIHNLGGYSTPIIRLKQSLNFHFGSIEHPRFTSHRLATPNEKQWLLNCITANKLVERPKELTYEIW